MFNSKDIEIGRRRADPSHPLQRTINWEAVHTYRRYGIKGVTHGAGHIVSSFVAVDVQVKQTTEAFDLGLLHDKSGTV